MWFAIKWVWRWSLVVTVPVACLFVLWVFRTGHKYHDLGLNFRTLNDSMSLHLIGRFEAMGLKRDVQLAFKPRRLDQPPALRQVQLYLPESSEAALNDELPHSGREYVRGGLQYANGELGEVKVRYRGDHFWHWGARKKSIRVKTKKSRLYERMRAFNLSVPKTADQVAEQLSNELVQRFGLIGPKSELVELWVNGERRGIHLQLEQLEEMVLRTNGRMPGDLYAADIVGRDVFHQVPVQVFRAPGFWEKIAINNHFLPEEDSNLRSLLELIRAEPSPERSRSLRDLVDLGAFARFSAYRTLCQTFHFDDSHNQRLYYDPWRNHFVPVVWDPLGWHPDSWRGRDPEPILDVVTSELDVALFQDPEFLALRQEAFEDWFESGRHGEFMARAEELVAQVDTCLDRDPGLAVNLRVQPPAAVRKRQQQLLAVMDRFAHRLREEYLGPTALRYAAVPGTPGTIRFESSGRRVPRGVELEYQGALHGAPRAFLSFVNADGKPQRVDVSQGVTVRGHRLEVAVPLPAQLIPRRTGAKRTREKYSVEVAPAIYQLTLVGGGLEGNSLSKVTALGFNGARSVASRVPLLDPTRFENIWSPIKAAPLRSPVKWSGRLTFEGVQTITEDVIIEPGTAIAMGRDASIIFQGRVLARGTASQPIRIGPVETPGGVVEPFGTVALRGSGSDGSMLSFVEMRLGSGLKEPLAEFSAMLSIHDVDQVVVEDCSFFDSRVVDDMVHAVYSTVRFERCQFVRSLMDALDIDISEAVVKECAFIDSGNDALDLMTSTVAIMESTMQRSVDKGASVGEDTQAIFVNCSMVECGIGVQIKDRSRATLTNCSILRNTSGVDAYKKNWRYDSGGFGFLYNCTVDGNQLTFSADKESRILVHDSYVSPEGAFSGEELSKKERRRVVLDQSCDANAASRTKASYRQVFRFPQELDGLSPRLGSFWNEADPRRRGPLEQAAGD